MQTKRDLEIGDGENSERVMSKMGVQLQRSSMIDVTDETLHQTTTAANETTFQVKHINFHIDANVSEPSTDHDGILDLAETSPLVSNDDDVFKVPTAPISTSTSFSEAKLSWQKSFDISDNGFQSGGSKFFIFHFIFVLDRFFLFFRGIYGINSQFIITHIFASRCKQKKNLRKASHAVHRITHNSYATIQLQRIPSVICTSTIVHALLTAS